MASIFRTLLRLTGCIPFHAPVVGLILCFLSSASASAAQPAWSAKFDSRVRFYQMTELGILLVGTEKSLYAVDGETGEVVWKRKNARLAENDVAPVTGTDLVLLNYEKSDQTRFEAADILSGDTVWRSDKVRGAPMQMAVDLENHLLAVVVARDAKDRAREGFKRRPMLYVFDLRAGADLWKYEIGEVEMMPARWSDKDDEETAYTLDNYHPPMFLDGRLYLFYEGVASFDARNGGERIRERFRINEEGLALTEADAVVDEGYIYTSGRGRVRAVSRNSGRVEWEAKDLGLTPEMLLAHGVLYVRTGGRFTRLKDGETAECGPYGVSAIDTRTGKILWRYKGADKGITNIAIPDASTVLIADRDDLIWLDARTGERQKKVSHRVKDVEFVLLNEQGEAVMGGANEIAAFEIAAGRNIWRARHDPPSRGILRTILAISLRAASLYFRYGGLALTAFRGVRVARAAATLRWSGIARAAGPNLSSLAANAAREAVSPRFSPLGVASRVQQLSNRVANARNLQIPRPTIDVEERLIDRIDPARQMDRLSRFLWHRRQFATLRGQRMYFYTDLKRTGGRGLAGVNVNTGNADREIRLDGLDERFVTDEAVGLLFTADGNRLSAFQTR